MQRRSFLKFLSIAPMAGPVAAKEAAASMGLSGPIGATSGLNLSSTGMCPPSSDGDHASWIRRRVSEFFGEHERAGRLQQARGNARVLDADIAAMRSLSPSAAYQMQVTRELAKIERNELTWLQRNAKNAGVPWIWRCNHHEGE